MKLQLRRIPGLNADRVGRRVRVEPVLRERDVDDPPSQPARDVCIVGLHADGNDPPPLVDVLRVMADHGGSGDVGRSVDACHPSAVPERRPHRVVRVAKAHDARRDLDRVHDLSTPG